MRDVEKKFLDHLKHADDLNAGIGQFKDHSECESYEKMLAGMLNTYSLSKQEMLEEILASTKLANNFAILACHWVYAMADLYKECYWDERDKAAVTMCWRISNTAEFHMLYNSIAAAHYDSERAYPPTNEVTHAVALTGICVTNLHHTLRQTYTGFVLTFLMSYKKADKLYKAAVEQGIVSKKNVSFWMV